MRIWPNEKTLQIESELMGSIATLYPTPVPVYRPQQAMYPAQPAQLNPLSAFTTSALVQQTPLDKAIIRQAIGLLGQIRHLPQDEPYVRQLGVNPVFQNGQQALQVIQNKGIRVEFGDMGDSPAHAQWMADQNLIMINQRYKGDTNPATLFAISEAIYHEAGHAAGNGDDNSSVQEELNCLALNTLAHRYHTAIDPNYAQTVSSNRLLADGVALYPKLFFDADPQKQALVNRIVNKYGDLALTSPGHEVPTISTQPWPLAQRVKTQFNQQNPFQPSPHLPLPVKPPFALTMQGQQPAISPPRFSYQA